MNICILSRRVGVSGTEVERRIRANDSAFNAMFKYAVRKHRLKKPDKK